MQSRLGSALEALTNIIVGYFVAILTQSIVFPWFGFEASVSDHAQIAGVFTLVSLLRSYVLRRAFNRLSGSSHGLTK